MRSTLTLAFFIVSLSGCTSAPTNGFSFALLGDNPYSPVTYPRYERLIDNVNEFEEIQWIIHVGDVKGGGSSCSDVEFRRYFDLNQRFDFPFIVTPGDNDWLDCKRRGAGGFNEYERLDSFRQIFYPAPGFTTGAKPMQVTSQPTLHPEYSEFVENVMWSRQAVVFAAVHVVALTEPATDIDQWQKRVAAATAWIRQVFREANTTNATGVFIAMQADPWIFSGLPALAGNICPTCFNPRNSLEWLYPLLVQESLSFNKPVVLAVGDTHVFRVDKPLYTEGGELVSNFTRVESFGNPLVHWVNVLVEPDAPWVFSFREQLVN